MSYNHVLAPADRIVDPTWGPSLAPQPRKRFRKDTVLIVDGTKAGE